MSVPIQFPPGVTNLTSKNAEVVNWRESNLIRWDNGVTMRPVGGWEKLNYVAFPNKVRKMHRWSTNAGLVYTAYLCEASCFVDTGDNVLIEITPAGGMTVPIGNSAGYGDDVYSKGHYGTPRPGDSRLRFFTPVYSMDNWGEDLRFMTSTDGRLLGWAPSAVPGTVATPVTGAPIGNRSFIITPERHIMLFGMGAFDKFGWCDEEDDSNWAFTDILSRAGFYEVSPKSPIVVHQLFDGGIIMFTPAMSYFIEYVGLPYIYSYRPIGQIPVPVSPASICAVPMGVVWPSLDGWWLFDGTNPRMIRCDVWDFIHDKIDVANGRFGAVCVHLTNFGEVWWFWPDTDSPHGENNRYISFDYRNSLWNMGRLGRTCGFTYANDRYPVMSDGANIWRHEIGFDYSGAPEMPWIESFNLTPNGGQNWFTVKKILPDIAGNADALRFRMAKTNDRAGYTPEIYSPQRKKNGNGWVDIRETARDMRLRIDMVLHDNWETVGPILFDNAVRGQK